MPNHSTVLVLGGGVGGVVAATRLLKRLPRGSTVTLVEREPEHVFAPSLLWLASGDRSPAQIKRPIDGLAKRGIHLVRGEITELDPRARRARVGDDDLTADYLLVSLGAELRPDLVPGLAAAGHDLYTLDGAFVAQRELAELRNGKIVILTAEPVYKCPAAPYEAAMLLAEKAAVNGNTISLYTAEPGPMGVAGPAVSAGVKQMVAAKGVDYHPEHKVAAVDPKERTIQFENGESVSYDLLIYVPPHRAPVVLDKAGMLSQNGWIAVDRHTLTTEWPGVYVIGDAATIPLAMGKPLPKAGVFAHGQAEVVADNIAAIVSGKPATARFEGFGACFVETGGNKAGKGAGNFYAEPQPQVALQAPSRRHHLEKVLFEKYWLRRWF